MSWGLEASTTTTLGIKEVVISSVYGLTFNVLKVIKLSFITLTQYSTPFL